jgi:hypothetical protein
MPPVAVKTVEVPLQMVVVPLIEVGAVDLEFTVKMAPLDVTEEPQERVITTL